MAWLQAQARERRLLDQPDLLTPALALATALVRPWIERRQPDTRPPPRGG